MGARFTKIYNKSGTVRGKIKALNEDVDGFFNQEIIQYVRATQQNDFFLSDEESGIPAMNLISIQNTIREIRRDWLEGANTKRKIEHKAFRTL